MTSEEEDTASLVLLAHFENKLRLRPQERLAAIQTALERGADPHRCVGHVSHTSVSFVEWSFIRTDLGVLGVLVRHGIDPDAIFPENKIHWMTFLFYMFLRHLVGKDSTPFIYHKHAARDVTCILQFLLRHCGDRFELALAYRAAEMHRYLRCGRPGSGSVRTSIQLTQVMGVLVDARENQGFVLPLDVIRRMNNPVVQLIAGTIHGLVATITEIASIALVLRTFVAELVAMIPRFMAPPPCPDPCPYYIRGGGGAAP